MGGVVTARLLQSGYAPALTAGSKTRADEITNSGITLRADGDEIHQDATVVADVCDLPPGQDFDYVLIVTKATAVADAARAALPRTHDNTTFVAMQNGIVEPLVAEIVGKERVVPSLLNWAATMHAPGVYEQTVAHSMVIGEFDGKTTPRLQALAELLTPVVPMVISDNIVGAQWAKLQMNCSVTVLGALCGMPHDQWITTPAGSDAFVRICREALDVADAAKIRLETLAVDPYAARADDPTAIERWLQHVLEVYGKSIPSILVDLRRGKRTEVDFITGYVAQLGDELGISTPLCTAATRMVHEIEAGERTISLENISALEERD